MSEPTRNDDRRNLVREALRKIDDLQARLEAAENAKRAPIAVIGIGCRYPGGISGPDAFWQALVDRTDAIREVPADRWDISAWYDADQASPGKMSTRFGGFLDGVDQFDAQFFGISPREAALLDPQHRILLEVAWEALEHAAVPFADLSGSQTGIFVGMTTNEYYQRLIRALDPSALSPYLATGNVLNAAAGRLAFFLGTHGPTLAVDTACSSSLTAVHLACQSLRAGECRTALAGGVNVVVVPETSVMFSKWGMMAPDGRCKTFDAKADGFVRSEGCGVVVLKRLDDALAANDRVLAILEGSALNQDGRSSGLTVPNGIAQQALIRQALANANVKPGDVDYVEAHGTGTSLGDPIEVDALSAVFGPGRDPTNRLRIGSVKTNLGHTEAASGVAGLIKCVLALEHGLLPPQLHLHELTPEIRWDSTPIDVVTEPLPWPRGDRPRRAGVSAFGFSGTNVHVVVAEAPAPAAQADVFHRPREILALSARDPQALAELAGRYASALSEPLDGSLADFCFTANVGRAQFSHRAAVAATTPHALAAELARLAVPDPQRVPSEDRPKVAFLFTGQGSQYAGMGDQFYKTQPVFRAEIDRCADLLAPHIDRPLQALLFAPAHRGSALDQTGYAQPALFALEWSLAQLWRAWGVEPAALLGHSVGEYVAACQSGVMSLEDGLRLISARARLMQSLPAGGMMAAVSADEATARTMLARHGANAAIAAVNGPRNVVISGRSETVRTILDDLRTAGISAVPLNVSHAFHSPLLEPILDPFERIAAEVPYRRPTSPLVSNLTGEFAKQGETASAHYWRQHARSPVRFASGIQTLHRHGCRVFLEIGPSPVLINMGRQCLADDTACWLPTLNKGLDDWTGTLNSLAELYRRGVPIDWAGFDRGYTRRRVSLPTYPYQRKRFWVDAVPTQSTSDQPQSSMVKRLPGSPLVKELIYEGKLSTQAQPWLADHVVAGQVVVPMTAWIAIVVTAGAELVNSMMLTVEDVVIRERLIVPRDESVTVQLVLAPIDEQKYFDFRIISIAPSHSDGWILHATGRLRRGHETLSNNLAINGSSREHLRATCVSHVNAEEHYRQYAARGIEFGPAFRAVQSVDFAEGLAVGEIVATDELLTSDCAGVFHPSLLDACLQPLLHAWPTQTEPFTFLPFAIEQIDIGIPPSSVLTSECHSRASAGARTETLVGDVTVRDASRNVVVAVRGLTARRIDPVAATDEVADALYEVEWQPIPEWDLESASCSEMASANATVSQARSNQATYVAQAAAQGYSEAARLLEQRSQNFVVSALRALGWNPRVGDVIDHRSLAIDLGVQARHWRLLGRMIEILGQSGFCESAPGGWTVRRALEPVEPLPPSEAVESVFAAEFKLLDRCGTRLADVLQGLCDPLDLLFGPETAGLLETLYSSSPSVTATNQLAADVFSGIVAGLPAGRKLRVLEIGAGTGGTTAHVLSLLPPDRTGYHFTDISPSLVARARRRFADWPFVQYDILDIERDLESQGFAPRDFDVILAANVLHATPDLRSALGRVRTLLARDGLFVLLEGTRPQSWVDLTFGLTDGWWKFSDSDVRPDYPLISASHWRQLLDEQGFPAPEELAGPAADGHPADYTVFVAGGIDDRSLAKPRDVWAVFVDNQRAGDQVAAELERHGRACVKIYPAAVYEHPSDDAFGLDPTRLADYDNLLADLKQSGRQCSGIVHMWFLNTSVPESASAEQLMEAQNGSCRSLLNLSQSLISARQSLSSGLWIVTRGSQAVGHDLDRLASAQAAVWGFGKVLALEHPEFNVARLDLGPDGAPHAGEAWHIAETLLRPRASSQWALRADSTYVPRLVRSPSTSFRPPVRLVATEPGRLDSLQWEPTTRRAPGPGEVEIRVEAIGLNFRDVLSALGMYAGDPGPLGGEVAGVIVAVGAGVNDWAVGDAVAALAPGGFNQFVVTAAELLIKKPADWTFAEIATVPSAFATAYHALVQLAKVRRGQTVLIHSAAGGVGLAAIQLAHQAGCKVIATAGSEEKRGYLRSLGVDHVFDSRSLDFADGVRDLTSQGLRVDVIINTLTGEFIDTSLSLLSPGGCFVELGKRGIWDESQVAAARPDVTYFVVDLAARCVTAPAEFQPTFAAAATMVADGTFRPLPLQGFPRDQTQAAFRLMAQARHIGKIVVSARADHALLAPSGATRLFSADESASYLITGGTTGLGLRTVEWLAARGAKHLVLMARSAPDEAANRVLATLQQSNTEVKVCLGDVAEPRDVDRTLDMIRTDGRQLRGVIHSAGVLDDGALHQQDWSRFERVFSPKLAGAWNLHRATREMPLDFFVCYSSASAILGSRGQANHAAANSYLDSLMHHRRSLGLPALSINWGPWTAIGAAARRNVFDHAADSGIGAITPDLGIAALERLMVDGCVQAAVIPMDWNRFLSSDRPAAERAFFEQLGSLPAAAPALPVSRPSEALASQLTGAPPGERRRLIQTAVREAVIGVLGLNPDFVLDPRQAFRDLGFDSLMSVEMRNRLQTSMGRPLPATLAFDFPSLSALVDYFCQECSEPEPQPPSFGDQNHDPVWERELAELSQLSQTEADQLLADELARARELLT